MNVSKIAPYAKAAAAVLGALLVTVSIVADGTVTYDEFATACAAWGTAAAVFYVRNAKAE